MNYSSFRGSVAQRASIPPDRTDEHIQATLATLAQRLTSGEALDLAAQLPQPMQTALRPSSEAAENFDAAEFIRRVAEQVGTDEHHAKNTVRAVFATLREAVSSGEFDDILAQLPCDFCEVIDLANTGVNVERMR